MAEDRQITDEERLKHHEEAITMADMAETLSWEDKGFHLREIRDNRLYKLDGHRSFELYCKKRWNMTRRHADRLIKACTDSETRGSQNVPSERSSRGVTTKPKTSKQPKPQPNPDNPPEKPDEDAKLRELLRERLRNEVQKLERDELQTAVLRHDKCWKGYLQRLQWCMDNPDADAEPDAAPKRREAA